MSLHPDVPVRLRIPKLQVNVPVEPLGRTQSGEMQAPATRMSTGWYNSGFLPGSIGNAAIAGHSTHIEGRGAFYDLAKLTPGDEVHLDTASHRQTFRVAAARTYPSDATQLQDIFGPGTKARLNLITCTGIWSAAAENYSDRLVVFTEFADERPL